jgi:hypothetical protein
MTGSGFEADPGVLDGITRTLTHASADLDSIGNSMPGTPDGGDGTPALAGIMAHIIDNAGQLVIGAAAAGDAVTSTKANYQNRDADVADAFRHTSVAR